MKMYRNEDTRGRIKNYNILIMLILFIVSTPTLAFLISIIENVSFFSAFFTRYFAVGFAGEIIGISIIILSMELGFMRKEIPLSLIVNEKTILLKFIDRDLALEAQNIRDISISKNNYPDYFIVEFYLKNSKTPIRILVNQTIADAIKEWREKYYPCFISNEYSKKIKSEYGNNGCSS